MLSIIVPVYNGARVLEKFWQSLSSVLSLMEEETEVLFIDDGSRDSSLAVIKEIGEKEGRVRWVSFCRNSGQQAAVLCGLRLCRGDCAVTMDDDLGHPPAFLPILFKTFQEGQTDALYALPSRGGDVGRGFRDAFFTLVLSKPRGLRIGSFRIFSRKVIDHIVKAEKPFVYISAELFKGKFRVGEIEIPPEMLSPSSESRYSFGKRLKLYFKLVLWYSPLIEGLAACGAKRFGKQFQYEISERSFAKNDKPAD